MDLTLQVVERWARQAGAILQTGFGKRHTIDFKSDYDLVTEIDQQAEDFLFSQIRKHFPTHTIIGEENGEQAGNFDARWYIDPVDGTTNYAHGFPYFCVSLAFVDEQGSRLGVIYDPIHDECFTAERGGGAFLNGERMSVSSTKDMLQALMVTGFSHNQADTLERNLRLFAELNRETQAIRRFGSAALNMANVAAGRLDGYYELAVKPWDIAAGALIAREAGGLVSRVDGEGDLLNMPCSVAVTNPHLHNTLLAMVRED
jgi:myo-inositol-1(or 4)-monophosphatase